MEGIVYADNLYFEGLSLRKTSKALSKFVNRSHAAIRDWIGKYKPQRLLMKSRMIAEFLVNETLIKVRSEVILHWIAIS
jgi:putative transposase